jgi:hypothetical protein
MRPNLMPCSAYLLQAALETNGGRFLLVVWVAKYRKTKIITARDMSKKEKQVISLRLDPKITLFLLD